MAKPLTLHFTRAHVCATLAYGLFLACTSVMLWGGYVRFLDDAIQGSGALMIDYFSRGIAFPVALFITGAGAYLVPRLERWRSPWVALGLFWIGGALLVVHYCGGLSLPLTVLVCGLLFGCGSGVMFATLQHIVAVEKVFDAGTIVFAAAGISAMVFFLVDSLPADVQRWFAFLVLAPCTVALTLHARRLAPESHPMLETVPRQRRDRCREAAVELWRPLLCIAFSAFIVGMVRVGTVEDVAVLGQVNTSNMIGLLVASVALLLSWKLIYERITLMKLYLVMFPLTATAFLLLPLLDGSFRTLFVSFVFLVFSITSSFMVISCARTARNQCLHPVFVYGVFAGVVYAFSMGGSAVGLAVGAAQGAGFAQLSVVALVAIYALSLAMTMQRRQKATAVSESASSIASPSALYEQEAVERRVVALAQRYSLSRRESEVLEFLARGRDVPFIAEELVISKNTVRSHVKSIFSKAGVHSRQELLDLIETVEA